MIDPIEAMADAIMAYEGWKPGSRSNRNRNPGNLRAFHASQARDAQGFRVFPTLREGYWHLCLDLKAKFTGQTSTGLGPDSSLFRFFTVYAPAADHNEPVKYARFVAAWLSAALQRPIVIGTRLGDIWRPPGG